MKYNIKALKSFKEQIEKLDKSSKKLIYDKIQLIKENPYRNKKIHSRKYSNGAIVE